MELVRQLAGLSVSHVRQFRDDDSYIDRLSHRYTTTICVVFAILVTTKQYAGKRDFFFFCLVETEVRCSRRSDRLLGRAFPVLGWRIYLRFRSPRNSNLRTKRTPIVTVGLRIPTVRREREGEMNCCFVQISRSIKNYRMMNQLDATKIL